MPTIDILKAIYKVKIAWDSVGQTTIINCFRKAGFNKENVVEEATEELVEDSNYQDYMQACYDLNCREEFDYHAYHQIDNELPACEIYSDENVVATQVEEAEEEEEVDLAPPPRQVSKLQATESLNILRDYLLSSNDDCRDQIEQLFKIEATLNNKPCGKQTSIKNFFKKI